MSGRFVLLASYPKSGNTWLRIVLEHLRRGVGHPFSINDLEAKYHGIKRRFAFDRLMPVNAADLLPEEIDVQMPDIWRRLSAEIDATTWLKVHDCAYRTRSGEWPYPPDCAADVIYLVRHPFDVAVSMAHHMGTSLERAVGVMAEEGRASYTSLAETLPQIFGSWSGNIESWLDNDAYNVTWARYEDLCTDPTAHFLRFAEAAGLRVTRGQVTAAVEAASFQNLQREEDRTGFRERVHPDRRFFREGRVGTWKDVLDDALREQLVRDHGRVMERLGYGADGSVKSECTLSSRSA